MASRKQIEILKSGVENWNKWREEKPEEEIKLGNANLNGMYLCNVNLTNANLNYSSLKGTKLTEAKLIGAKLVGADLTIAELNKTNLKEANLLIANLYRTNLLEVNLSEARIGYTSFGGTNLKNANNIEKLVHFGPSYLDQLTLRYNRNLPVEFLRGCGLQDWEIKAYQLHDKGLSRDEITDIAYDIINIRAGKPILLNPVFISYSHGDAEFVDRMEKQFNKDGIRFWRDIHHATSGRMEKVIDLAIRKHDIVLIVLSKNSIKSDWVEHEVRKARAREKETGKDTLCPIALDDSWKNAPWPERLMEQIKEYNILDFSNWRDDNIFDKVYRRLLDGWDIVYKAGE